MIMGSLKNILIHCQENEKEYKEYVIVKTFKLLDLGNDN